MKVQQPEGIAKLFLCLIPQGKNLQAADGIGKIHTRLGGHYLIDISGGICGEPVGAKEGDGICGIPAFRVDSDVGQGI